MKHYTIRGIREHTGELVRNAEAGHLSVITKHGKPVFVAVPFDETLLQHGSRISMAITLLKEGEVSLEKSAKMAGCSIEVLLKILSDMQLPLFDHSKTELEQELKDFE